MQFYPGILSDSVSVVADRLAVLKEQAGVTVAHIDIMDGWLVDDITVAPLDLVELDFGDLRCDLHLMVDEPIDFVLEAQAIKEFLPIRTMIGQVEHMSFQKSFIEEVKVHNWQAGLSLNLHTPVSAIDDEVWPHLSLVQIMGVEMGKSGQVFQPAVLDKINELRLKAETQHLSLEICVDGGVKLDLLPQLQEHGVSSVVATSAVWQSPDPAVAIEEFIKISEG